MYLYTIVIDTDQAVNLLSLIDVCAITADRNAHNKEAC